MSYCFDVMLNGRFVCTLRMPLTARNISGFIGEKPIVKESSTRAYVEKMRPSLRGKDYKVCPIYG